MMFSGVHIEFLWLAALLSPIPAIRKVKTNPARVLEHMREASMPFEAGSRSIFIPYSSLKGTILL